MIRVWFHGYGLPFFIFFGYFFMIEATSSDKNRVIEILTFAFRSNASVSFIAGNSSDRLMRICDLMDYAFEVCFRYGKVVLSEDRNACALVLFPDKKVNVQPTVYANQQSNSSTGAFVVNY